MGDELKVLNQKRINHLFDVLNSLNNANPQYCSWICTQIEDMKFKNKYNEKT